LSIISHLLGKTFHDQALYVRVDTGQENVHLLFDCGENVLHDLKNTVIQQLDHIFFSHFHIDHIAGFDTLLRNNYNREKPIHLWGPQDAHQVLSHRLQGFTWNLTNDQPGIFYLHEILKDYVEHQIRYTREQFKYAHILDTTPFTSMLYENDFCQVHAILLPHHISCAGYLVQEKDRYHVNKKILQEEKWMPGSWLQNVKNFAIPDEECIEIQGKIYCLQEVRKKLLQKIKGSAVAYLTDFYMDTTIEQKLIDFLPPHCSLFCESQYLDFDKALANLHQHLHISQAIQLARKVHASSLTLFHFSHRYSLSDIQDAIRQQTQNLEDQKKMTIHISNMMTNIKDS
jgi:ribonuclease Z